MESHKAPEKLESWIKVINPETQASELQKKLDNAQSEKKLLKQDVAQYHQDIVNTLKSVDLAKLNYEKLEVDLKESNDALKKQSLAADNLLAQNIKQQNQINKLKKIIKNNKTQRKQNKKLIGLITYNLSETMKNLIKADSLITHFEKIAIQLNAEVIRSKKESAEQKALIEKLSTKKAGFFSPKEIPADSDSFTIRQPSL